MSFPHTTYNGDLAPPLADAVAGRGPRDVPHRKLTDPKDVVRRGYDAVSLRYDEAYGAQTKYQSLLGDLCRRIPVGGTVLDLGCGSGVPVARALTAAGYRVTGIDISEMQIRQARERVPQAEFIHAGATAVSFGAASFDAHALFWAYRP